MRRSKTGWPFSSAVPARIWRIAEHCLYATTHLYCDTPSENFVLSMMIQRSWAWDRYEENMKNQVFQLGSTKAMAFPLPYERTQIWRARVALRDKGILLWETPTIRKKPTPHIINLPGLCASWRLLAEITGTMNLWKNILMFERRFQLDFARAGIEYPARIREAKMVSTTEAIEQAKRASAEARERKLAAKRKAKVDGIRISWLPVFFKAECAEHDLDYHEKWTGTEWGMAKNWLKECASAGKDPRDVIRDVVANWSRFRSSLFHDAHNSVMLSPVVSFRVFYAYRAQIAEWLLADSRRRMDDMAEEHDPSDYVNVFE